MNIKYFDNNANCPIDDQTLSEYTRGARIGNVSCETKHAERGKAIINELKSSISCEFSGNCNYKAIITSGGSEANSTVIAHYIYTYFSRSSVDMQSMNILHFVCSSVEHPSITDYLERLERDGVAAISWIKPKFNGEIDPEEMVAAVQPNTACVFLQSVNSETGCVQNITALELLLKAKSKTLNRNINLHVDHVQGFRRMDYPKDVGDTISLSLHKIGAPLGIGLLLSRVGITPLIAGKQNGSMRGGTYNIGAIEAALGACKRFRYKQPKVFKQHFLNCLSRHFEIVEYPKLDIRRPVPTIVLFSDKKCMSHTLFFAIMINSKIVCGMAVKKFLFAEGYTIGTGTACANESANPLEHGSMASSDIPGPIKKGFIRVSFGCNVDQRSLEKLAEKFAKVIKFI